MIIYPAVDIIGGRCVSLKQGDFNEQTVFDEDPLNVAIKYRLAGASYIHVVDLDGARTGSGINNEQIRRIAAHCGAKVQVGGGIRNMENVAEKFALGVDRVIIGTAAIKNPDFVKEAVSKYGNRIIVGIDANDGLAAVSGWEEVSEVSAVKLALDMRSLGVKTIIYTDISKDGMMKGPNIAQTEHLFFRTGLDIIASGGVSGMDDLKRLKAAGVAGAITGMAVLTGALSLKEAITFFEQ
ncbi:MAG: 1-(5-phosphoribosyl)-5-[(5-phosphoribosylamino)methylideneamino]imidazole-4-carboxamide isomerase [Clostridiales bacterium]|jgi:phosphoribosylformimino-5-aminoimidazole carboxamide ribotide isomerase|nr:1-(5-phosphoribosyl)-5-[(5-phosphoribosylamino)methylideneamino]imidazole-4-carboxamide isomerase [Clostridiales bacterium]